MAGERVQGDDETLMGRVGEADLHAFETLYDRYCGPVYSLAMGMLRDAVLAQEVTQDVFLAIWRGAREFDARRGSARAWILSVAHHKSVDAVRRWRRTLTVPLSDTITSEADVIEAAQARVDAGHVRRALEALSVEQRTVIVLAYYGGYSSGRLLNVWASPWERSRRGCGMVFCVCGRSSRCLQGRRHDDP